MVGHSTTRPTFVGIRRLGQFDSSQSLQCSNGRQLISDVLRQGSITFSKSRKNTTISVVVEKKSIQPSIIFGGIKPDVFHNQSERRIFSHVAEGQGRTGELQVSCHLEMQYLYISLLCRSETQVNLVRTSVNVSFPRY